MGAVSGIQDYVFATAVEGGRQARRLRARSFFVQLLGECAALRVRHVVGSDRDAVVLCAAGRFLLRGGDIDDDQRRQLDSERDTIERWLLTQTGWQLRFSLVTVASVGDAVTDYHNAMKELRNAQASPGAIVATGDTGWRPEALVLPAISPPCHVCRARLGEPEVDEDTGEERYVCLRCAADARLGAEVTERMAMVIRDRVRSPRRDHDVLGLGVSFVDRLPSDDDSIRAVSQLRSVAGHEPDTSAIGRDKVLPRPLLAWVPRDAAGRVVEFEQISRRAMGDALLGVMRMDVDALGDAVESALREAGDFNGLTRLSNELDLFFGRRLAVEQEQPPFDAIYTVFAGGDDLLVLGPWNVVLDYAVRVQGLFRRHFNSLTVSAGIAFFKPKFSIRYAIHQVDELIAEAKTVPGLRTGTSRAQCATLGGVFKWPDLADVIEAGRNWTEWVRSTVADRSWLHQLLDIAEVKEAAVPGAESPDAALAAARLAHQVERNAPSPRSRDPRRRAMRRWLEERLSDLDAPQSLETIALGPIVRYALIATRRREE